MCVLGSGWQVGRLQGLTHWEEGGKDIPREFLNPANFLGSWSCVWGGELPARPSGAPEGHPASLRPLEL